MIHNLADDITFLLIKNKVLDIEQRDIYIYGLEVILLNIIIIPVFIFISLLFDSMINFWAYVIFFLPLRIFSGGYHADTSERCFCLSVLMYILSIVITNNFPMLYRNLYWEVSGVISLIVILIMSPFINENNPLNSKQKRRNSIIVYILLFFDLAIFILSYSCNLKISSNEFVFIIFEAALLLIAKSKRSILRCK